MYRIASLAVVLAVIGTAATQTLAAEHPPQIRNALERLQKVCAGIGGKPGSLDSAVVSRDVNGDGRSDFVIDLGNATCEGRPDAYCVSGFCALEVYTWRAENDWKPLLVATVSDWRTGRVNNRPALILTQSGSFCGKPNQKFCTVTYTFADGKMRGQMK
jgi:hypothetical protein